jgi:hypothetical protein
LGIKFCGVATQEFHGFLNEKLFELLLVGSLIHKKNPHKLCLMNNNDFAVSIKFQKKIRMNLEVCTLCYGRIRGSKKKMNWS